MYSGCMCSETPAHECVSNGPEQLAAGGIQSAGTLLPCEIAP